MRPLSDIWHAPVEVALVCVTVFIHAGVMLLGLRFARRWLNKHESDAKFFAQTFFLFQFLIIVMAAHVAEMLAWGLSIYALRAVPSISTAIYFAIETYTTLGYGDVLLPLDWRLMSGLLATTGLLMFAWSTAIFATILNRLYQSHLDTPGASPRLP